MKIVFLMTSCKRSGPVQQMLNIIKNLDRKKFEPYLVTIYNEVEGESLLHEYLPYVIHKHTILGKKDILLGRDHELRKILEGINPDVIHSLGAFPDFAISRIRKYNHVITLRGYAYDDYLAKFGKIKGYILTQLHFYAIKRTTKVVTCSESLSNIFKEKLNWDFDFIRNGVDIEQYTRTSAKEKDTIRKELKLPADAFVYIYTGQMIERKNVDFLLQTFAENLNNKRYYLVLLGGGELLEKYRSKYANIGNIDFRGNVSNVNYYLKACDVYVSTSFSEGLPNGVLEAMATGLPVVLSDISQHLEIYNINPMAGYCYSQGNPEDLVRGMLSMPEDYSKKAENAYKTAHENFSASGMSKKYQELYLSLVK